MKKIFFVLVTLSFLIGAGMVTQAQSNNSANKDTLPDSPFYFIKGWQEGFQTLLTYGAENKAKQFLHLANVRFAEYEKMVEKGKDKIAQKTLEKYQKQLDQALDQISQMEKQKKDTKDISQQIKNNATKALVTLERNIQKVPDSAKPAIQKVIDFLKQTIGINSNTNNDANNSGNNSTAEQKCITAGGTVKTMSCCKSVGDFPNSCGIGACGCSTTDSKDTKFCDCGTPEKCFNGNQCVSKGNSDTSANSKSNCVIKKGASMTYEEAKAIAVAACGYPIKEQHSCNSYTGTWWIDLDVNKPGCSPACVVNVTTGVAEINWRCTGLLQ